jgi:hypothetical protein
MSKFLIQLLGVKDQEFRTYIERLEHVCLQPGVDIRLSAEVATSTRGKIKRLGIDTADVQPAELFVGLQSELQKHDELLQKKLKIFADTDSYTVAKKLALAMSNLTKQEHVLCLTAAATKRVLKAAPPTKTLRALKLRSLDSVMKRFDPRMLYAVACLVEGTSWKSQVHAKMKRVSDKDIVWESVEAIAVPEAWYEKLAAVFVGKGFYHVNKETGVVLVMPVVRPERPGAVTLGLSLLLQSAHRLAMEGLPYKRRSFIRGRQTVLPEVAHGLQPQLKHIHGLQPSWPVVYQLFGAGHVIEEQYDADLLLGDLEWQSIESKLAKLVPDMNFWLDSHYLAYQTDHGPISLHIVDVASSLVGQKRLGQQDTAHLESSLWNELQLRYLKEDVMAKALMKQLMSDEELVVY